VLSTPVRRRQPFDISTIPIARDTARLGIGFDEVSSVVSAYGSCQASLGSETTAQYITGGVRVAW
jgi:uncharacterized protein with beta-barrel porin domain